MTTLRALVCVCVCVCAKRQQKKQKNTQHTAKKSTYFLMTSLKTLLLRGFCCCCRCSLSLSLTPSWARVCVCTRVARCAGNLLKSRGVQPNKYLCIKQQSKRIEVRTLKLQIRFEWHRAKVSYLFALFGRTPQNTHAHLSTAANWCDKLAARTHTTLSRSLSPVLARSHCLLLSLLTFFFLFAAPKRVSFGGKDAGLAAFERQCTRFPRQCDRAQRFIDKDRFCAKIVRLLLARSPSDVK